MRERQLVVAAIAGALILRVMHDADHGVDGIRKNARAYVAIGMAASIAGLAVEIFPPAGLMFAGTLVVSVALSSAHQSNLIDPLTNRLLGGSPSTPPAAPSGPLPGLGGGIPYGAPSFPAFPPAVPQGGGGAVTRN